MGVETFVLTKNESVLVDPIQVPGKMKSPFGKQTNVTEPVVGKSYLKVYYRVIQRGHDGYCSAYHYSDSSDDDGHEVSVIHVEKRMSYFEVPPEFQEEETVEMRKNLYDTTGRVWQTEETECLFADWYEPPYCSGSGVCGVYSTCIPYKIEYVVIV